MTLYEYAHYFSKTCAASGKWSDAISSVAFARVMRNPAVLFYTVCTKLSRAIVNSGECIYLTNLPRTDRSPRRERRIYRVLAARHSYS